MSERPEGYEGVWPPSARRFDIVDRVTLDAAILTGMVDVFSQGRKTRMLVKAFVRARRKARKTERRNRKAGRQ